MQKALEFNPTDLEHDVQCAISTAKVLGGGGPDASIHGRFSLGSPPPHLTAMPPQSETNMALRPPLSETNISGFWLREGQSAALELKEAQSGKRALAPAKFKFFWPITTTTTTHRSTHPTTTPPSLLSTTGSTEVPSFPVFLCT